MTRPEVQKTLFERLCKVVRALRTPVSDAHVLCAIDDDAHPEPASNDSPEGTAAEAVQRARYNASEHN